ITGYKLDTICELANIDHVLDWALSWGARRKAAAAEAAAPATGDSFNGNGSGYSIEQIEEIVRTGAPEGANRSNLFHAVVGHFVGGGWEVAKTHEHWQHSLGGTGGRYLSRGRWTGKTAGSARKYAGAVPLFNTGGATGFEEKPPPPQPEAPAAPRR